MPIRKKILCGTVMLAAMVLLLASCSLGGFYAYRELVKAISTRANDLPRIDRLVKEIDELRSSYQPERFRKAIRDPFGKGLAQLDRKDFIVDLQHIQENIKRYVLHLRSTREQTTLAYSEEDLQLTSALDVKIEEIIAAIEHHDYLLNPYSSSIEYDLYELSNKAHQLPVQMHRRMAALRDEVRYSYRTWYGFMVLSAIGSFLIIFMIYAFFRRSVVQPFKELLAGTRLIAKGNFDYRIQLSSGDELSELADALNAMTERFVQIRDHLNEKVQDRTREVVRSEQLASVGFLAAGVAHEINNPLASIAWSAEAIESRLHELLHGLQGATVESQSNSPADSFADHEVGDQAGNQPQQATVQIPSALDPEELNVLRRYLKRIQDEAFRCKGITERLLDFSRLGESQRRGACDVNELVSDVIALVEHLAPYRNKKIEFTQSSELMAWVSPTEFKQVVLNLLTNALDSTEDHVGVVRLTLDQSGSMMRLIVEDNGCGMTEEVQRHLYEPFFTRRRDGKGTGLGLSITYRIVQDHGGAITASSDGPGRGSRFQIMIPLEPETAHSHDSQKYAA